MNIARIINHWENSACDGHCGFCLYGECKDCSAEIAADTKALIREYKAVSIARDELVGTKVRLLDDIEELNEKLEKKIEEVYPEFVKDYNIMKEELEGAYAELEKYRKELEITEPLPPFRHYDGIDGNPLNLRGVIVK